LTGSSSDAIELSPLKAVRTIDAKRRRVQILIAQGSAERQGENRILVRRDLLATLEQREVTRVGQQLAEKHNTPFRLAKNGERIYGTFEETVQLASLA
jgi:hypothetical protein